MVFVSDVVDELVDNMWVEFISDDDDEYYQYGSEYYGSEIYSSDYDDYNNMVIARQIARPAEYAHQNVNAEHKRRALGQRRTSGSSATILVGLPRMPCLHQGRFDCNEHCHKQQRGAEKVEVFNGP